MPPLPKFLIVDADDDSRALLRWTLMRMYPRSVIHETVTQEGAVKGVLNGPPSVAIVHRAGDADGVACVRALRAVTPDLPILVLSASDIQAEQALAAGATSFLKRDQWLRIREVLDQVLGNTP